MFRISTKSPIHSGKILSPALSFYGNGRLASSHFSQIPCLSALNARASQYSSLTSLQTSITPSDLGNGQKRAYSSGMKDDGSNFSSTTGKDDKSKEQFDRKKSIRKLIEISKKERYLFLLVLIGLIISSGSTMYLPIVFGEMVNAMSREDDHDDRGMYEVIMDKIRTFTGKSVSTPESTPPVVGAQGGVSSTMPESTASPSTDSLKANASSTDNPGAATDTPSTDRFLAKLKKEFTVLSFVFLLGTIAIGFRIGVNQIIGLRIQARMRKELFQKLLQRDLSFYDKRQSGELINRLGSDINMMSELLTKSVVLGVKATVEAGVSIGLLLYISKALTLTSMSLIPPTAVVAVFYGRYVRRLFREYTDALAAVNSQASEKLSNIRTVKSFVAEERECSFYEKKVDSAYEFGRKVSLASGAFHSFLFGATGMAMLIVLYKGSLMTMDGSLSVGDLTSFLLYTIYAGSNFSTLSTVYSDIQRALGSSDRVFALLEEGADKEDKVSGLSPEKMIGDIEFHNVSFSYPTRPEAKILKSLSVKIPAGKLTALVSESGQGKSTITHLLARLYNPQEGHITVDGIDIRDLNLAWLRKHIAIVPQEPILFHGTIRDNILYSRPDATEEEIREVVKLASCDFIWNFPDGLDTVISERGASLSGGQRQRIAIARCLLNRDSKIIILDEFSSNLDSKSEYELSEVLKNITKDKTVILITHRLSSVREASQIVVLDHGSMIQQGDHEALMKDRDGKYFELARKFLP